MFYLLTYAYHSL